MCCCPLPYISLLQSSISADVTPPRHAAAPVIELDLASNGTPGIPARSSQHAQLLQSTTWVPAASDDSIEDTSMRMLRAEGKGACISTCQSVQFVVIGHLLGGLQRHYDIQKPAPERLWTTKAIATSPALMACEHNWKTCPNSWETCEPSRKRWKQTLPPPRM